jgi:tetratricopeptide (TPR) repeat protein
MSLEFEFTESKPSKSGLPNFQALELLSDGGKSRTELAMQKGAEPPKGPEALYEEGRRALADGDPKKAEKIFKTALDSVKPLSLHARLLNHAAGTACEEDNRWGDAQKYYQESLKCAEALKKGVDNPAIAADISDIARMDARQGRLAQADAGYTKAEEIFENFNPRTLPRSYTKQFARTYEEHYHLLHVQGEPERAAVVAAKLKILEQFLGDQKPEPRKPGRAASFEVQA